MLRTFTIILFFYSRKLTNLLFSKIDYFLSKLVIITNILPNIFMNIIQNTLLIQNCSNSRHIACLLYENKCTQ